MARGPGGAPAYGAWLAHAGRLIASNQRLIALPIGIRIVSAIAFGAVVLATRSGPDFGLYARDAVRPDERLLDIMGSPVDAGVLVAITAYLAGVVLAEAWLAGAFIASLRDGELRWHPGWRAFANLVVLYAVSNAAELLLAAYARWHDASLLALLVLVLFIAWPTIYADYAIVLEGLSAPRAIVRSFRAASLRIRETLTLLAGVMVLYTASDAILSQQLIDSADVFPPFLVAILLVEGSIQYCADCAGIAVLLEVAAREPSDVS